MSSNKSHVINLFKLHGLAVRSDGAKYLCELLDPLPKDEHDEWIEKVIDAVQKLPISSTLISKEHIHKAAQEVGTSENDDIENLLQIVDIYKVPKLMYNLERKKFVLAPTRARDLHGDASDKAALFRDRALIGNINYFGGQGNVCAKNNPRLQQIEQENKDAMFVVLSDVWLDKIKVTEKLQTLFNGYAQFPPTAFIFCGNFVSSCHGAQQAHDLRQALGSLGTLIAGYPELMAHSRFIFTSPANITEEIKKAVPSAFFVSNPCRLLFCTQEIVIFRENIVAKMCRNCFAKTLVSQGHLAALPLHVLPVYWGLDHCLSLHPTPDVIITADKGDSFTTTHNQSIIMNPGSFAKTDFSFKVYMPATRQVEDSQIADDDT
ncbi:DNA polymerase epsilon subunit 2-like [Homarus americanus]|uniref:DNA polymerase II subunit 2 n=1 Tax=Homarus americanus TaxID=6706 RepID=A0A8J5K675_HOMAM|nr:DNA polymerase epsilon subunit 2-like [Homarus americanus]